MQAAAEHIEVQYTGEIYSIFILQNFCIWTCK